MVHGHNPVDRSHLKTDFVDALIGRGASEENSVSLDTALGWFAECDHDTAEEIIEELHESDAPFVFDGEDIWYTDRGGALDYLDELERDPPWYKS